MIVARITPAEVETAYPNPSRIDCYTCHQIHVRYTSEDWTLTTTDPVIIYAFDDVTYDGGTGNICANCHQPRRQIEEANNGIIEVTSTFWGPHHGPNSTLLLGIGGAGEVEGSPSAHYSTVEDTCVTCHLGENDDHSLEPNIVTCQGCHADAETYDINGLQTEIQAKLAELEEALIAMDMLESDGENRYPIPGTYQVTESQALWNYIFIGVEDSSFGVHNPTYTKALLDWSIDALNQRQ
jgi:hypothetical protein